ncbi:hypothetical protein ACN4EG_19200 [Alkalinema pantanalense CENA528]|uniref:hypothetical protein n=1 Tax=Alkalinema pantanalense TaxID=1620705 RepID=UPI003D6DBBB9
MADLAAIHCTHRRSHPICTMLTSIVIHVSHHSVLVANSGIPLFSQSVFYQVFLLLPIIAIEAYVHRQRLAISILNSVWLSIYTNVISTLLGGILVVIPFGAFLGQSLLGSSVPVQPGAFPFLPLEIMVTLIPMYVFSAVVEGWVGSLSLKKIDRLDRQAIGRSFWLANAFTYGMLEVLAIAQLVKGYLEGRG